MTGAAPAGSRSPVPLILGGGVIVIIIAVVIFMMTSPDSDKPTDSGTKTSDGTTTSRKGPAGSTGTASNEEDIVDQAEEVKKEYERKKILAESDAQILALARWCKKNDLLEEMREAAALLLKKNPNDSRVHRLLGNKLFEGEHPDYLDRWLTPEEHEAAMKKEEEYQQKRVSDPRFDAMEHAISNARHQYLRDFKHFAVREWPYVIFMEDFGTKQRNDYYAAEKADQVRAFYRYMRKTFPGLMKKDPEIPFRVIVFKDRAGYDRFNSGQHKGTGGSGGTGRARAHFSLMTRFVYYYEKNEKGSTFDAETTLGVLFHECTHQLLNFLRPRQNKASPSMWFEEAFAEYIGAVKKTGKYEKDEKGEDRMTFKIAQVNKYRLAPMQRLLKTKQYFPLPTMFMCRDYTEADNTFTRRYGTKRPGMGKSLLYCEGWSFLYFCMNEPSGKYRDKIIKYLEIDVAGDSFGYETLCKCFGLYQDREWDSIQKEWEAYTRRLKAN